MQSDNSFQFSGGTWGAAVAFAMHAAQEIDADNVSVVYGEFGPIATGAEYAETTLRSLGVSTVQTVPFPIISTDLGSPMQAAWSSRPDAIIVLAADTGCKAAFDAAQTIGIEATLYFVGACASPNITESIDPEVLEGTWFNVEGPVDRSSPDADFQLYEGVLRAYAPDLDPVGAATVSARSVVNLWAQLLDLGPDGIEPGAIADAFRAARDVPSFMGHPYTCDGKQFGELTATCAPQQILVTVEDGVITQSGDWIDVGAGYPG
jgi:branched-chain amino acid transport system substrate-binding protein